jgi:shikimate kinase
MGLDDTGHKVVLMGLMGSGKTTVGHGLATRLGWPFHDSDDDLARVTGVTARQLVARDGAVVLHAIEAAVLLWRLRQPGDSVIAAAASTVERASCRGALGGPNAMACWLRVGPATLAGRFEAGVHRPRYGPDRLRSMVDQAARREALLRSFRPLILDAETQPATAVVATLADAVRDRWPSAP